MKKLFLLVGLFFFAVDAWAEAGSEIAPVQPPAQGTSEVQNNTGGEMATPAHREPARKKKKSKRRRGRRKHRR